MAANMHMAGAGPLMTTQQQMQLQQHARSSATQYGHTIMARLQNTPIPPTGWQSTMSLNDRVGRALELYVVATGVQYLELQQRLSNNPSFFPTNSSDRFTNVTLGSPIDPTRALDMSINFEIQAYSGCTSKVRSIQPVIRWQNMRHTLPISVPVLT